MDHGTCRGSARVNLVSLQHCHLAAVLQGWQTSSSSRSRVAPAESPQATGPCLEGTFLDHLPDASGRRGCKDREAKGMQTRHPLYGAESDMNSEVCVHRASLRCPSTFQAVSLAPNTHIHACKSVRAGACRAEHLMTPVQEATKTWHWNCASARSQRALRGGLFCADACPNQAQQEQTPH